MLPQSEGAQYTRILGFGSAIPSRVVTNTEMCTYIESTDEWIQQRTGIAERRWIGPGEDLHSLSLTAGQRAISAAGLAGSDIDAIIVSTVSNLEQTPSLAVKLAFELGTSQAAAFDISGACAGFCYALAQAEALVRAGSAKYVLIIGAETLSVLTDKSDRTTAFLFSDGAGAAVVAPAVENGIGPVVWGSDGSASEVIYMTKPWDEAAANGEMSQIGMNGAAVFRWATSFIAKAAKECLERSNILPTELDVFVPHQANNRITDTMLRYLKLPKSVAVARTITTLGNNSAASIPIAIDQMLSEGTAHSGDTALIIGFGAGLVYAGQVITLP